MSLLFIFPKVSRKDLLILRRRRLVFVSRVDVPFVLVVMTFLATAACCHCMSPPCLLPFFPTIPLSSPPEVRVYWGGRGWGSGDLLGKGSGDAGPLEVWVKFVVQVLVRRGSGRYTIFRSYRATSMDQKVRSSPGPELVIWTGKIISSRYKVGDIMSQEDVTHTHFRVGYDIAGVSLHRI